jgi:hypothetical protein
MLFGYRLYFACSCHEAILRHKPGKPGRPALGSAKLAVMVKPLSSAATAAADAHDVLLCCTEAEGSEEDSSDVSLVDEDDMEQDSEDL